MLTRRLTQSLTRRPTPAGIGAVTHRLKPTVTVTVTGGRDHDGPDRHRQSGRRSTGKPYRALPRSPPCRDRSKPSPQAWDWDNEVRYPSLRYRSFKLAMLESLARRHCGVSAPSGMARVRRASDSYSESAGSRTCR